MKLHLPISLRCSLLACFSTVHALFPTLAAGHIGGGALLLSLAAAPFVQAAETSYTNESFVDLTLQEDETVNFSGTNTISGTLNMEANDLTINLADGATLTANRLTQGANVTHNFNGSGTLEVADYPGADQVNATFTGTKFYIGKEGTGNSLIGAGSTFTFKSSARFQFGASDPVDPTSHTFVIWSWSKASKANTILKLEDSSAYFGSNLEMKEQTSIHLEGNSSLDVKGNLKLAQSGGGGTKIVTISSAEGAASRVNANVGGNVVFKDDFILKLSGNVSLVVSGDYNLDEDNSGGANNTTLDVGIGSTAQFDSLNLKKSTTLTGGGWVTAREATGPGGVSSVVKVTDGTHLVLTEGLATDGRYPANSRVFGVGTSATMTLSNGSSFVYGSREEPDALKYLILWSWNNDQGSTLNVTEGSELYVGGNLDMKQGTTLNVTGEKVGDAGSVSSSATIAGDLITSFGNANDVTITNKTATITGGKTVTVGGNLNIAASGTLAVTGSGTTLNVAGVYNSPNANNTTLEVGADATATFGSFKTGTAATIQGGGQVTVTGNLDMAENASLTLAGSGTTLTVTGTMNMTKTPITVNLADGASLSVGSVSQGADSDSSPFTHTFQTLGEYTNKAQLTVGNFGGKDCMTLKFNHIDVSITEFAKIGSGSTYTLDNSSYAYGSQNHSLSAFTIWSWGERSGSSLNLLNGSDATFHSDLALLESTAINMSGSSVAVNGNLLIHGSAAAWAASVATLQGETPVGEGSAAPSMSVSGDMQIAAGYTLKVLGSLSLTVTGTYNSQNSNNTTLEVASGATASFGSMNAGTAATIQGGGRVTNNGNISMADGGTLTLKGDGTTLYLAANNSEISVGGNVDLKLGTTLDVSGENSSANITGNLSVSAEGDRAATVTGGKTVTVDGDLNVVANGTLAVTGKGTVLNVTGGSDSQRSVSETAYTLIIGEGAKITENKVRATGQSLTVNGIDGKGGTYNVESYVMSADADSTTELYLKGGVTMHITGTDNGTAAGGDGSFVLSNNWGARHNKIDINGSTLISEAAFSNKANHADINITNNGRLQLNKGLAYYGDNHTVTLTVDGTSTLGVVGNDKSGAEHMVLNLANGATIALGAEGAEQTLFNHAINADAAAKLKLCADGNARFDAVQPLHRESLHVLAGKGTLELHGEYALGLLESAIVNEGTLSITEGTTFDLTRQLNTIYEANQGTISGTYQFISNAAGASLTVAEQNISFVYNDAVVGRESLQVTLDATGALNFDSERVAETLYWDGYSGTTASGDWQHDSTLWSETEGTQGDATTGALDSVVFGVTPSGGIKDVQVGSGATNGIRNMSVTEGGYTFNGSALKLGKDLTVTATGRTVFNSDVTAAYGNVSLGNRQDAVQGITTEVTFGADLSAANLYVWNVASGAEESAATGTYTFNNVNVSGDIHFHVNDQRMGGFNDPTPRVQVNGTLTANSLLIDGNAAMEFDGKVTVTDTMTVLADNDDHNIVQLKGGSDIRHLVLDQGAKVLLSTDKADYRIGSIDLGDATLRFDAYDTDFKNGDKGYTIYSTHDNATLKVASITRNLISLLDGNKDNTPGAYHSFSLYSQARTMNIGTITDLKDFTVYNGVAVIDANAGSAGAIHGDLRAMEAALLSVNANNIMAAGSGKVVVNNSYLHLKSTEQTLYAKEKGTGNGMDLDMAFVLGDSSATGLHVVRAEGATAGELNADYRNANDVSANVLLDSGTTLNLRGEAGASLTLSGVVSGAGNVAISGEGSSVTMSKADTNRQLTGNVTVDIGAELTVAAQDALYGAHVSLLSGGTLTLETGGKFPVRLQSLAFATNTTINIDSIQGTNVVDANAAAILLQDKSKLLDYEPGGNLTFNFTISDGASMNRMKAYNIFAGNFDFLGKGDTVGLHIFNPSVFYYNSKGERVQLESHHFVRGYLHQGDSYVYYIRTRAGNIWAGDENGSGTWKAEGGKEVWYGMTEGTKVQYDPSKRAALFVDDVSGKEATVTLSGEVAPGTAYFQAELTEYTLTGSAGNYLAKDTIIDVRGAGGVTLNLAGNADMDHAISELDAYVGTTTLAENLAVSDKVLVRYNAKLTTAADKYILTEQYKAGGTFEKVTLSQKTIGGTADTIGIIENADIQANTAPNGTTLESSNGVTLEYVSLKGTGTLDDMTIGEGVSLAGEASYTLTGTTYYDSTINMSAGSSITLADGALIDIGGLDAKKAFSDDPTTISSTYTYKLLDGDLTHAADKGGIVPKLSLGNILVDGVNLSTVKGGILTLEKGGTDLQPGEFKLVVNGADVMEWDPRWNEGGGPALGKVNTTDAVLYNAKDTAEGGLATRYLYSNYVNATGADNIIVASLSRQWTSSGGKFIGSLGGGKEIWVFNQGVGAFDEFVVGSYNGGDYGGTEQTGDTHLVITGGETIASTITVGGSYHVNQGAKSFITLHGTEKPLKRGIVIGGSWGADQSQASHVFMDGGEILTRLVAGSYNGKVESSWLTVTGGKIAEAYGGSYGTGSVDNGAHSTIKGGTFTDFYGGSQNGTTNGGAHTIVTGGTFENLYGGGNGGTTNGAETQDGKRIPAVELTVDGAIAQHVFASGKAGTVNGDVVLNLLSGSALAAYAGGSVDHSNIVHINGDYIVRLGSDFVFSNGNETDSRAGTLLYGGLQSGAGVTFEADHTSRLELVSENATYDFAGPFKEDRAGYSTKIMGFKEVLLANGVTMIVHNDAFNNDQDLVIGMLGTETAGKSLSATVVYGNYKDVDGNSSKGDRTKSITLKKGITLKLNTSYPEFNFIDMLATPHLYVESGATFDITGFPREQGINDGHGSIAFQLHLKGYGVGDKGALFKGEGFASSSPDGKAALGHVILDDNASVNADGANIIFDYANHNDSYIEFNRHTLTKIGSMVLRLYQSNEGVQDSVQADGTTLPVTQGGTMYVQEGTVDYRKTNQAIEVDYVLGSEGTLSVTFDEGSGNLSVKSLSGAGTVKLNPNTTLSIHSDFNPLNSTFYKDWMDKSEKYNIHTAGGYVYGVFSGKITSEDGSPSLIKTGKGTQALFGDKSDYRGLTIIQDGTLYLMGSSVGNLNGKGVSATMTSGAAGLSSLVWQELPDGNPHPVLRLGHDTVTYNNGYALGGEEITIAVAAAPKGVGLDTFAVHRGNSNDYVEWVRDDGKTYRRVDTSSLKSVNVNGWYADGSAYTANTDIDRSRALFVAEEDLDKRVSAYLNTDSTIEMHGSVEGEQLDNAKLSNGMKLDCNAYYGNGEICMAGKGLDLQKAQEHGVYVPSGGTLSPETADLLLYKASPLVYARTTGAPGTNDEKTTYYNQYELIKPMGPGEIGEATSSDKLRHDAMYYVRYVERSSRETQMFTVYMTYDELAALLKKKTIGVEGTADYKNYENCTLVAINRICVDVKDKTYNDELAANTNVELMLGEVSTVVADVPLNLNAYTVKVGDEEISRNGLPCNGYYVNSNGMIVGHYLAGTTIEVPKGAQLVVPEQYKDMPWVVVTGLSSTGYEEAVFSGILTDDGKTASHLQKEGAGTLVLDQQSLYTGNTLLKGGTLRLRGWADLQNGTVQNGVVRRSSGSFDQTAGTSLMLSYDNKDIYMSNGGEVRELSKNLELVGSGDSRWRNEAETDHQTAALISDVGKEVSFTLSGVLSGTGNLLHSGEGQLHISGANIYEGGTTVTRGVTYVESSTALGATAKGASAKVVTYAGSTLVLTNGLGGLNAEGLVDKGYVQFHSNHNSIKGTVLIGGYAKGTDISKTPAADPGVGQGSTLLMSGNGYWAENTIISKNSALVFNGSGSSNYTVDGMKLEMLVDQSAANKAGHLGGAGKLVVSGPAGKGLAVYFANIGESVEGAKDNFTGGIRVEGNNSRLFFGNGDYTATAENGGIHVTGYFSRLNAENSNITVANGGRVALSSLGYYSNPDLNPTGTGTKGAAGIRAKTVTVQKGGTLAARNAPSRYIYNLTDLAKDTQVSVEDLLPGNRGKDNPAPDFSTDPGKWQNILAGQTDTLSTAIEAYKKAYDTKLAVNKNRAASVNAQVVFEGGSCYETYFANTRLGQGATLTLEAGATTEAGGATTLTLTETGVKDNRIVLDLSTNGNDLKWGEGGRGISQIVLFSDVENMIFKYGNTEINTAADAYKNQQIFYAAAKDFFVETQEDKYLSDNTYLVYDKSAGVVYLDAATPEPTTTTLSLLALAALCARRRRK